MADWESMGTLMVAILFTVNIGLIGMGCSLSAVIPSSVTARESTLQTTQYLDIAPSELLVCNTYSPDYSPVTTTDVNVIVSDVGAPSVNQAGASNDAGFWFTGWRPQVLLFFFGLYLVIVSLGFPAWLTAILCAPFVIVQIRLALDLFGRFVGLFTGARS